MSIIKLNLICFSPTGTSKIVAEAIASSFSVPTQVYDLTLPETDPEPVVMSSQELCIMAMPVYSGRLPKVAIDRLSRFIANETPVVLVVVYGNRHYDDALAELRDVALDAGFKPLSAAAFVGEHSYSTLEQPLASGRPDVVDISLAKAYGQQLIQLLEKPIDTPLQIPGDLPYKERKPLPPLVPTTIVEACDLCGLCAEACPTAAIEVTDSVQTKVEACIWCAACVKVCPAEARVFENEVLSTVREKLTSMCQERREPELFIP